MSDWITPVVLVPPEEVGEGYDECNCIEPDDNDKGCCRQCGYWINYKSRE